MFKQMIRFPQQEDMEPVAGGIMGLHDHISPTSRQLAMLSVSRNMRRHGVSAAITRPGRYVIGNRVGESRILGLSHYYKSDGTRKLIAGADKTLKVYDFDQKTWKNLKTDLAENNPHNAVTFNDLHIITNGVDNVLKYDGTTIDDLGGNPPKGKYISSAYQRVAITGISDNPHWIRFSDIANPEEWIDGDSATIPVNDKDGDEITWAQLYKANWVIWKRNGLFELHGPEIGQTTDNWSIIAVAAVGTPNGRTIVDVNGMLYWLSDSDNARGIVRWSGGRPVVISEPVENIIKSINYAAIDTACAATSGDGEYILAVPTGESKYPDTILVYNAVDNSWWVWDGWKPSIFLPYKIGDAPTLLIGDHNGAVYAMGGTLDDEAPEIEKEQGPALCWSWLDGDSYASRAYNGSDRTVGDSIDVFYDESESSGIDVIADENNIYMSTLITLESIDKATGERNWEYVYDYVEMGEVFLIAVDKDRIYSRYGKSIYCHDTEGNVIWSYTKEGTMSGGISGAAYDSDTGSVYCCLYNPSLSKWYFVRIQDGNEEWIKEVDSNFSRSAIADGKYYAVKNKHLQAYSLADGTVEWQEDLSGEIDWYAGAGIYGANDDYVFVMAYAADDKFEIKHSICCYTVDGQQEWKVELDFETSGYALGESLYVIGNRGVKRLSLADGQVEESYYNAMIYDYTKIAIERDRVYCANGSLLDVFDLDLSLNYSLSMYGYGYAIKSLILDYSGVYILRGLNSYDIYKVNAVIENKE